MNGMYLPSGQLVGVRALVSVRVSVLAGSDVKGWSFSVTCPIYRITSRVSEMSHLWWHSTLVSGVGVKGKALT